jgi:lipopolysaccharide transport system permease protein
MISPVALRSLWAYRGFVLGSVKREFQSKYSQAVLGALWSLLSPLAMIAVYTVIFSEVMHSRLPASDPHASSRYAYSIYLCAGVLTWGLFAEIVARAQGMFIEQANLLKKLSFPRICVPAIVVLNALASFGIIFGLFTLFLLASGNFPGLVFLALVPVLLVLLLLAAGLGMVAGVLNVFFRDVGPFLTIALQFWFWLTPVVYPVSILPPQVASLLGWNPMARLVGACQDILVAGKAPDWSALLPVLVLALLLCAAGLRLFRRHAGDMVDEL